MVGGYAAGPWNIAVTSEGSYGYDAGSTAVTSATYDGSPSYVTYVTGMSDATGDTSSPYAIYTIVRPTYTYYNASTVYGRFDNSFVYTPIPESPEEKKARLAREKEEARKRQLMDQRATRLFIRVAGYKKWKQLKKRGYLDIVGPSGARYRLSPGKKIKVMGDGDKVDHQLCLVFPESGFPDMDLIVQEYLLLTSGQEGEEFVRKTARRWNAAA